MSEKIAQIALPLPLRQFFDYVIPQSIDSTQLMIGARVIVPFRQKKLIGFLIAIKETSSFSKQKLKEIVEILDKEALFTKEIYELCQFAADYYQYALGEVLSAALPVNLRKNKIYHPRKKIVTSLLTQNNIASHIQLTKAQETIIDDILTHQHFQTFLLDGITGSGKTEIYLQVIAEKLKNNQQILVLIPEISLTPQTILRFEQRFSVPIAALHSEIADSEKQRIFEEAKVGTLKIVLGTRSAVFTPFKSLSLIVVDEEHDTSFKQQDRFRYHARDIAIMRGRINNIPVILGSATPSLESLLNAKKGKYQYLQLNERAGGAKLPRFEILDMRSLKKSTMMHYLLLDAIKTELSAGNQVMLFVNRRGFAPILMCNACSLIFTCTRCDVRLIYYHRHKKLRCPHCESEKKASSLCHGCGSELLNPVGFGTERLENFLTETFPQVPIIRLDRDTTKKKGALVTLLNQIHHSKPAILLGTQMLAKGHHFKEVTLVGILSIDQGLFSADFRATQQMGQLFIQVSGRAGRELKEGKVYLQTHYPDHVLLKCLMNEGYRVFAEQLLKEREMSMMPPYSYLTLIKAESFSREGARNFLEQIKGRVQNTEHFSVLGPVSPFHEKCKGKYSQQILLRSSSRHIMNQEIKKILNELALIRNQNHIKWMLDVDPLVL